MVFCGVNFMSNSGYYEKVLGEGRKFYFVERPKAEKVLPEILSKEEVVVRMIRVTDNLKHKCPIRGATVGRD